MIGEYFDLLSSQFNNSGLEQSRSGGNPPGPGDEAEKILIQEIRELQEENARVKSRNVRLRSDIATMEALLSEGDKERQVITQRVNKLKELYESRCNNVMSKLEHIRTPGSQEKVTRENLDSYMSKLQTLCTADGDCADETQRPVYDAVKSALQDLKLLPKPE